MQCFSCHAQLDGDAAFVEHHLNRCLDEQDSRGTTCGSVASGPSREVPRREAPRPPSTIKGGRVLLSPDEPELGGASKNGRSLAQAGSAGPGTPGRAETPEEGSCPCCGVAWTQLGLSAARTTRESVEERRAEHVEACLQSPDCGLVTHGEAEDAADQDAAAERRGQKQAAQSGKALSAKGAAQPNGDAVHETAVNSTPGLIDLLAFALSTSHASPHGRTSEAYLATDQVEHVATRVKDYGWGCGYKNVQMIFSSFRHAQQLDSVLPPVGPTAGLRAIPPIRWWQQTIEAAWRQGFDPEGAAHFKYRLVNSRRWIGTTEIYTALSSLGVRTQIVDFPKSKGASGMNLNLLTFILDYFRNPNFLRPPSSATATDAPDAPPPTAFDLFASSGGTAIRRTDRQPLYLQHDGHSRTIVGIEVGKQRRSETGNSDPDTIATEAAGRGKGPRRGRGGGSVVERVGRLAQGRGARKEGRMDEGEDQVWLLLFDPGKPIPPAFKKAAASLADLRNRRSASSSSTSPAPKEHEDMQLPHSKKRRPSPPDVDSGSGPAAVTERSASTTGQAEEERDDPAAIAAAATRRNTPMPAFGDVLKLFRVDARELKRKDDYQILFVDPHAPPLSGEEKERRKTVTSIVIGGP